MKPGSGRFVGSEMGDAIPQIGHAQHRISAIRSPFRIFASVQFALWFRELKTRYAGSRLGWVWSILEPLSMVAFFSVIMGANASALVAGIDYPVYVLVGFTFYGLVMDSITAGLGAIDSNRGLFVYRQVKPFDVVVARVVQGGLIDVFIMVLLLGLGAWVGYDVIPGDTLLVFMWLAVAVAFGFGLGLAAAVMSVVYPESKRIAPIITRPFFFISAVFVPLNAIPEEYRPWLLWNPLLHLMELVRQAWWPHFPLDEGITPVMVWFPGLVVLALALLAYRRYREHLVSE